MKLRGQPHKQAIRTARGSVLVIVLWVALGLVSITLYFANSMNLELRSSDNSSAGVAAEEAIEGAARYVAAVLSNEATNGVVPDVSSYYCEAVPVGNARFWLIGRADVTDASSSFSTSATGPEEVFFGLIDEGSKLNLNNATVDMLLKLTNVTAELAANIYDWRSTNGTISTDGDGPTIYSQFEPAYMCKSGDYESLDELRLVYPMDLGILFGEDANLNGILDPGEVDTNSNNFADPGILEHLTVYSREPSTNSAGAKVNISSLTATQVTSLLQTNVTTARLAEILTQLGLATTSSGRSGGTSGSSGGTSGSGSSGGSGSAGGGSSSAGGSSGPTVTAVTTVTTVSIASPLAFFRKSGMTLEEFAVVATNITVSSNTFVLGRVNVNTASAAVLCCLPGITPDLATELVNYRRQNPDTLTSIAWVAEALGQNNSEALDELQAGDYVTTESYQYTADIAAVGPFGRGYRRVKYVFDVSDGTPRIVFRQDLTHLGWALGKYVRQDLRLAGN